MEGHRVASAFVGVLRERGLLLKAENVDAELLRDRSACKLVEALCGTLQNGTLAMAELERWSVLDAAGVGGQDGFDVERALVAGLQSSICQLQAELAQDTGCDVRSDGCHALALDLCVSDDRHACFLQVLEHAHAIYASAQAVLSVLNDTERSALPGCAFETLHDWQAFTLATIDGIEQKWLAEWRGAVPPSDSGIIAKERLLFVASVHRELIDRVLTVNAVLQLVESAVSDLSLGLAGSIDSMQCVSKVLKKDLRAGPAGVPQEYRVHAHAVDPAPAIALPHYGHVASGHSARRLLKDLQDRCSCVATEMHGICRELEKFNKHG